MDSLGINIGGLIEKEARSIVPESVTTYGFLQEPPYDPFTLQLVADRHWVVRTCIDKLKREAVRKGFRWEPKYETKCDSCGAEYDFQPLSESCPDCESTSISKPDKEQLVRCDRFLDHPNPQFTMMDVLERNAGDLLTFDDFYVSTGTKATALEVWPEDVRFMRIEADKKGRLGGRTFCPVGEDTKELGKETELFNPLDYPSGAACPNNDGGTLKAMAFAQTYGGNVVAAFSKEEVLHDNLFATGTRLFGNPKIHAIQTQVQAMALIDTYQKESFEKAKTPKNVFVYKGFTDADLARVMKQQEEAKRFNAMADMHIPIPPQIGSGQGNMGIEVVRGIDTPLITGSIQFLQYYEKAICKTFGVDPASIGEETPGKLGSAQEESKNSGVSQEAIQQIQVQLGEAWDRFLKLKFPEIKDWKFTLETAYEEEESKIWETKLVEMQAGKTATEAGLDIIIDEDGTLKISGENTQKMRDEKKQEMFDQQAAMNPFGGGSTNGGKSAATAASVVKSATKIEESDIEKASRWHREIDFAGKRYKQELDSVAQLVFERLAADLNDYIGVGPVERVDEEIADTVISRSAKVLEMVAQDAAPILEESAKNLYRAGLSLGLTDIQKQDFEVAFDADDTAAIAEFYSHTQDAMKNVLYFGDKQTYLTKIQDVTKECIEAGGCTTRILARKLQIALDPDREHFSDYMWERIAETDSAAYITAGRLKAYENFDVPKVRRITASNVEDDLCAPFTNAIYKLEDAYNVIPAHPFCRCAFAPYFGLEEPIDA